jgi:aminomethyltransferase
MTDTQTLRRTPLYDAHVALGARIVPFAGWEMPVQYAAGISAEHRAVRESCGLFDVSHMGEVIVRGPDAIAFVNHVTSNDVSALAVGQIQYSTLLTERGTIVDDLLVYRREDSLFLVVNAGNREADIAHLRAHLAGFDATMDDVSDAYALIAVQGPRAPAVVQGLADQPLGPSSTTGSWTAKWPACRRSSRARGTPVSWASSCTCRGRRRAWCGTRSWPRAR